METILQAIGFKNLRSIYTPNPLRLAPITVLVGKNSAGKSTIARTFPLLRQSCEAKTRAPILWFGERTDFGSFREALQKGQEDGIEFSFCLMIKENISLRSLSLPEFPNEGFQADISFTIKGSQERSYSPFIKIKALGFEVEIRINELNNVESITCSGKVWKPRVADYSDTEYQSILPRLNIMREKAPGEKKSKYAEFVPFYDDIEESLGKLGTPGYERLLNVFSMMSLFKKGTLEKAISPWITHYFNDENKNSKQKLNQFFAKNEEIIFGSKVNDLLRIVDSALRDYFLGVRYIEPLRATAQRYYRKQELAIDEIDSKGENVAMYLDSLGPWQIEQFNEWTKVHFGFSVKTQSAGGHVAIVVSEEGRGLEENLADIGFGFSQILPVIVQIWMSMRSVVKRAKGTSCLVIEQPELHLHPAMQAKLADVFAAVPKSKNNVQLIIETHSNHLINRFGQLINEGLLSSDDVQILILDKDSGQRSTITQSGYDDMGYLENWPAGFFEPEF